MSARNPNNLPPILYAIEHDLPPCPRCKAAQGDPCRSPSWKTVPAHLARLPHYLLNPIKPGPAGPGQVAGSALDPFLD